MLCSCHSAVVFVYSVLSEYFCYYILSLYILYVFFYIVLVFLCYTIYVILYFILSSRYSCEYTRQDL